MTCSCPITCAFRWQDDPRPSIFSSTFVAYESGKAGRQAVKNVQAAAAGQRFDAPNEELLLEVGGQAA